MEGVAVSPRREKVRDAEGLPPPPPREVSEGRVLTDTLPLALALRDRDGEGEPEPEMEALESRVGVRVPPTTVGVGSTVDPLEPLGVKVEEAEAVPGLFCCPPTPPSEMVGVLVGEREREGEAL